MEQETFIKQVPVAIAALGQHMHDHELLPPINIEIRDEQQQIYVTITEATQPAWLQSVAIINETNVPHLGPIWFRSTWEVLLPDLGIRFTLTGLRRMPATMRPALSVVSA